MKKKLLVPVLCVLMMLVGGFATWAYLTSQDTVVNTFTTGDVKIVLDEEDVDNSKTAVTTTGRDKANKYHLLPGIPYVKDPTVHVKDGSEASYVRMIVTVKNIDKLESAIPKAEHADFYGEDGTFLLQKMCDWNPATTSWEYVGYTKDQNNGIYEFRYIGTTEKKPAQEGEVTYTSLEPLFTEIMVPGFVDNDNLALLKTVEINVVAHAIQANGFADADEAWANFN